MNVIKKISVKTCFGGKKEIFANIDSDILRVYGKARGTKSDVSQYGTWTAFIGSFRAVNLVTGEEFASSKIFLPNQAEEMLLGVLGGNDVVDFGFDIGVSENETSATGYEFTVKPLLQPKEEDDPLAQMAKMLPAPSKAS